MKKIIISLFIMLCIISNKTYAQADELAQLALNVEKLAQFKGILSDLEKGYKIVTTGYGAIKNISEGNFNLHNLFLDNLLKVNPSVKKYYKISEIIEGQIQLVKACKSGFKLYKKSDLFNIEELDHLQNTFQGLFNSSLENLDALINVITANQLRMSDDERLHSIDVIHTEMERKLVFLHDFNRQASILAIQRAREKKETKMLEYINQNN